VVEPLIAPDGLVRRADLAGDDLQAGGRGDGVRAAVQAQAGNRDSGQPGPRLVRQRDQFHALPRAQPAAIVERIAVIGRAHRRVAGDVGGAQPDDRQARRDPRQHAGHGL